MNAHLASQQPDTVGATEYEQRHFNRRIGKWSDWYLSSEAAYREHCAGPVSFYEVRQRSEDKP